MKDSDARPAVLLVKGPFAVTYLALLVLGSGIAAALYWGIAVAQGLDPLPRLFNAQQGAARLDALRTALTAVGGAAAVAGLYLAYRRQRNNEADSVRELDKLFTDRSNILDQKLDSESSGTRLSGLTALVRLADDSDRDRGACLRQLCSYLRRRVQLTDRIDLEDFNDRLRRANRSLWLDPEEWDVRRAAAEFLAQCLKTDSPVRWTDSVDLREAVLIGANFENCTFGNNVDLRGSILIDASFKSCTFEGDVNLRGAAFVGEISFAWAEFHGGADWHDAIINSELDVKDTYFREGQNFDGVTFNRKLTLG
ncbi:MAG: pentapeptide repeat-containing protein [Pseudonocardiaceae bacterium]